jgi:DNA mismatch repair ATPase MutS
MLPDHVYTHFERREILSTSHGKLDDELVRIHDILLHATPASIIVMNERSCLNARDQLIKFGVLTCFPVPNPIGTPRFQCRDLRDVGLCPTTVKKVIGNDIEADEKSLIVVTGANEGGKSTFLRSVGAAQVMMQAGMFVAAESFCADVRDGVFTHFKREEEATMTHGKLDEELAPMSALAEYVTPRSLMLCNESFASTNEREGSRIARGIVHASSDRVKLGRSLSITRAPQSESRQHRRRHLVTGV